MPTRVAIIDSFDTPNARIVVPKKGAAAVTRTTLYPNRGPKIPKNKDKRSHPSRPNINGGVQATQILVLTSGPNPLLAASGFPAAPLGQPPNLAPWKSDGVKSVDDATAEDRLKGYKDYCDLVQQRRVRQSRIQIIKSIAIQKRVVLAKDESDFVYGDGSTPKRLRLDAGDFFVGHNGGYTRNKRYAWCPPGVRSADVQMHDDPRQMTAVGCTCRNMRMRGMTFARYGCKHIIAYNRSQAAGQLTLP